MTIGLVLSKTPTYSETFFTSKIRGLQNSGFRVVLFVQYKTPDFDLCEVRVAPRISANPFKKAIILTKAAWKLTRHSRSWAKFIKVERSVGRNWTQILKNCVNNAHILASDLDWLHFGFATMAIQSENVAKAIEAKMSVSLRGFDMDVYPLKHPNCYDLLWKRVDKVHSISSYLLAKAYGYGLSQQSAVAIIPPAIKVDSTNGFPKDEQLTIVTIGRLHWIKGYLYIVQALSILKSKGVKFSYHIIGNGPDYDELKYTVTQLGLEDCVLLLGKMKHSDTLEELKRSNLYIQYSNSEGFCNAVLEAQLMGCLCIVSDGGALPENIVDGETGFIVEKRNPPLLASAILKMMSLSSEEKNRMRYRARTRVVEKFNLDQQMERFKVFYTS